MAHRPERELKLQIRPARADEAGALETVLRAASLANAGDRAWLLAHPEVMVIDREHLLAGRIQVAEIEGRQAVGFATVLPPQDGRAEIDGIFVAPGHWRQGMGRALLQACVRQAQAEGATALEAVVNMHALGFYEALGFTLCTDEHAAVSAGVACWMRLELPAPG